MSEELEELLRRSKAIKMTPQQEAAQRRSFAYGNTKIENDLITREMIADLDKKITEGQ